MKQVMTLTCALLVLAQGCTKLTVTKVAPGDRNASVRGVRYSLPRVFLRVTPKADGGVDVQPEYLPDSDNTYAVDAESWFAKHTFKMDVKDGLLASIEWKPDTSGASAEAVKAGGELVKTRIESQATAAAADRTARQDALKAYEQAKLKATQAKIKYDAVATDPDSTHATVLEARIALQQALAELRAARDRYIGLGGAPEDVPGLEEVPAVSMRINPTRVEEADSSSDARDALLVSDQPPPVVVDRGNDSTPRPTTSAARSAMVKSPTLFALHEQWKPSGPELTLTRINQTGADYETPLPPVSSVTLPTLFPRGRIAVHTDKEGRRRFAVVPTSPLTDLRDRDHELKGGSGVITPMPLAISLENPTAITVDVATVAPGDYDVKIAFKYNNGTDVVDGSGVVSFRVPRNQGAAPNTPTSSGGGGANGVLRGNVADQVRQQGSPQTGPK